MEATVILDTSATKFAQWLEQYTEKMYRREPLSRRGSFGFPPVRAPKQISEPLVLGITVPPALLLDMARTSVEKMATLRELEPKSRNTVMSFNIIPLAAERVEVTITCGARGAMGYFKDLLAAIAKRWPKAAEQLRVEAPTPVEDEAGKKRGPMDTKLDALLTGQTAIRENLSGLRQAMLARFDASEQTIIAAVIERLDQDQLATVQAVLDAIEAELVPIGELEETLVAVQHTLSEIQQQGVALLDSTLASEEVERLSEVVYAPKLDVKHKLKLTVPIIPAILSYEGEVELKSGLNLEAVWKRLVGRVRDT